VQTVNRPLSAVDMDEVQAILQNQVAAGKALLAREKTPITGVTLLHGADMQFRGQTHLLQVDLSGHSLTSGQLQQLFADAYFHRFAVKLPEIGTMLINLNTTVIGHRPPIQPHWLIDTDRCAATLKGAEIEIRPVWFEGGWRDTSIYQRGRLPMNAKFIGPAIIQQLDSTVVVEPDNQVRVDRQGNLLIHVTADQPSGR
jgi:N-methylhydantoinase A